MSDMAMPRRVPPSAGGSLLTEAVRIAGRLEQLLTGLPSAESHLAGSRAFLRSFSSEEPPPSGQEGGRAGAAALARIVEAFGLSDLDRDLLVLAGLPEEHEGLASVLTLLHPAGEPRATAGLAAQMFGPTPASRQRLRQALDGGTLVRAGLLALTGDGPFFTRSLLLAPRLWSVLRGIDAWPEGLDPRPVPTLLPGQEQWLEGPGCARALEALRLAEPLTLVVVAARAEVAAERGAALAVRSGRPAVMLDGTRLVGAAGQAASIHLIARDAVPVVLSARRDNPGGTELPLAAHPRPFVLCLHPGASFDLGERPVIEIAAEPLSNSDRDHMWRALLPELGDGVVELAATRSLEPTVATRVARDARLRASLERRRVALDDVLASARARGGITASAAIRVRRPVARWSDLVLPESRLELLHAVAERVRGQRRVLDDWGFQRGRPGARGVRILLTGPPGTGKSLTAEVLASELGGLDLLTVNVAQVLSKWLGDSEKNLEEVFDAADGAQALLLFEEADGLFSRRTSEVSSSNDRHSNTQTGFLLSRLEAFEGVCVLSTNLRRALDAALVRRLEFVIEYDEPDEAERRALWRCHLPRAAPLAEDVDLDELSRLYPMTGGHIRNAAMAAAFSAAAVEESITYESLVRAIHREYQKSGRAFPATTRNGAHS